MSSYILDIVKNPIFIGLFGTIATYIYFYWTNSSNDTNNKKKKNSNTTYHILVSLCVGLILGFGSYIYFDTFVPGQENDISSSVNESSPSNIVQAVAPKINSSNIPSKSLVIPQNLPDVFIETYDQ